MKTRIPELKDKNEIYKLFKTVLKDTYINNDIWYLQDNFNEELNEKKVNLYKPDHYFLIAEKDNRIIGCIEYTLCNQLINELTEYKFQENYEIGTVYVHPDYQRSGIVNIMLLEILKEMSKNNINEFLLDCGFPISQKIWSKKFCEPQLRFKDHWGKDSDNCIWILNTEESLKKINMQN